MSISPTPDDALALLRWRDELLQIMFWYRGEGLGDAVLPDDLAVFLGASGDVVGAHLDRLVEDGYATRDDSRPPRYALSERGVAEGGRRFADEFAGLTGQAHGECNNPNCACHTLGPEACASHTARAH